MTDRRLIYRVILKAMMVFAIGTLVVVMFGSLIPFLGDKQTSTKINRVRIDLQHMQVGEIRKTRWENREVAVLKRNKTELKKYKGMSEFTSKLLHDSLDSALRSRKHDYFVYFNVGDTGNCPLFYDSRGFKDICSGKYFDTTGREKGNEMNGATIEIPPHYFDTREGEVTNLVIGGWKL